MVRGVSVGSRRTRRQRRARRRRAKLRESASAILVESARTARTVSGKAASTILNTLIPLARASARGVAKLAGVVLRGSVRAGRNLAGTLGRAMAMAVGWTGSIEWHVLFFALLFSLAGAVASVLAGEVAFAVWCLLSSLFLYVALRRRESG
jgi:hypothetical protein